MGTPLYNLNQYCISFDDLRSAGAIDPEPKSYQALAHYNDLRIAGAMEEYNRTHCTRVVDRSKTIQNRNAFEPYQALANGFLKCLQRPS